VSDCLVLISGMYLEDTLTDLRLVAHRVAYALEKFDPEKLHGVVFSTLVRSMTSEKREAWTSLRSANRLSRGLEVYPDWWMYPYHPLDLEERFFR